MSKFTLGILLNQNCCEVIVLLFIYQMWDVLPFIYKIYGCSMFEERISKFTKKNFVPPDIYFVVDVRDKFEKTFNGELQYKQKYHLLLKLWNSGSSFKLFFLNMSTTYTAIYNVNSSSTNTFIFLNISVVFTCVILCCNFKIWQFPFIKNYC